VSEAQHLADALRGLFADLEYGLFTAFTVAVDGLTAAQAVKIPAPRFSSHNSYHTCEIISIRHRQGLWLERS